MTEQSNLCASLAHSLHRARQDLSDALEAHRTLAILTEGVFSRLIEKQKQADEDLKTARARIRNQEKELRALQERLSETEDQLRQAERERLSLSEQVSVLDSQILRMKDHRQRGQGGHDVA